MRFPMLRTGRLEDNVQDGNGTASDVAGGPESYVDEEIRETDEKEEYSDSEHFRELRVV